MNYIAVTPRMIMAIVEMSFKEGAIWAKNGTDTLGEAINKTIVKVSDNIEDYYNKIDHIDHLIGEQLRSGEITLVDLNELLQQVNEVEGVKVDMTVDVEEKYLPYTINNRISDEAVVDDLIAKVKNHCDISRLYLILHGDGIV